MTITESRTSLRIKENLDLTWKIQDHEISGRGKVLNLSTTGLLMEARNFDPPPTSNCIFRLDSLLQVPDNFLPHEGLLVWSNLKNNSTTLCGIEFLEPPEPVLSRLRERIQKKIMEATNHRKIKSLVGVAALVILTAMMIFIFKQQNAIYENMGDSNTLMQSASQQQAALVRNYSSLYLQTKDMLANVTKELDITKSILEQTQLFLAQSKKENAELQEQLAALQAQGAVLTQNDEEFSQTRGALQKQIELLNQKNAEFVNELGVLKEQMRAFEGNIKDLDEGKALITLFSSKLKLVKTKMHYLKREAYYARISAQKERDRILLSKGNKGYLINKGQSPQPAPKEETAQPKDSKQLDVDVSFVE